MKNFTSKKGFFIPFLLLLMILALGQWNLCLAGTGSWGDQGNGTFKNPVLNADYSDPDIIRVGSDFYMVASEFHFMGMPVLHSKDLVNWTIIGQIYTRMTQDSGYDSFNRYGRGSWAPSIRYYNNKYWVFFCTPDEGLYMSNATNPAGPWSALTEVKRISNWEDPCPFWDDDGQAYLGHSVLGAGPIIIHKMSADGTQLLDNGTTVYNGPTAEGTKIYKRNGYYYIWIPEGGVGGGWQTVLRATNIYGPYTSKRVLEQGSTGTNGPHQGGWVELASGESWFMHFQDRGTIGRICHLQPVVWQNDWPIVGQDYDSNGVGEPVPSWNKPNVGGTFPISAPQTSDEFSSTTLGFQWEWNHNPVNANWSLAARSGYLRLTALQGSDFMHAPNTLTQKVMGRTGNAITEIDITNMVDGQKTGLCHMSSSYNWIGVERTSGTRTIKANFNGTVTTGPNVTGNTVWMRTNINLDGSTTLLYSQDGTNFIQLGGSCGLSSGYWKGTKIGIFNYNSGSGGGIADFNWFHYTYDGPGDGSLPTSTPAPTPVPGNMGVNCGGNAYTDGSSKLWAADQAYATGGWGYATGGVTYSTADAIANTTDDPLYQSERYVTSGNLEYRFTVSNGNYNVTLKYAEIYQTSVGARTFDVQIEGVTKETGFDIYALGGHDSAVDRTYSVTVSDGVLNVVLVRKVENPKISAIWVAPASGSTPTPGPTSTPTPTPTTGPTSTSTPTPAATATPTPTPANTATPTSTPTPASTPTPTPTPASGSDSFNSSTLGAQWSWVRQDNTHWSLTAASGYMRITTQYGDLFQTYADCKNILLQNASGDFTITTKLTFKPSQNWQQAGLVVYQDDNNYAKVVRVYNSANYLQFSREVGGTFTEQNTADGISGTTLYYKLVKSGSNYSGYYSTDGTTYTQLGTTQSLSFSPVKVGLIATNGFTTTAEINADFDYFNIN